MWEFGFFNDYPNAKLEASRYLPFPEKKRIDQIL